MNVVDPDHWREIYEVLRGNKLRTGLTAFGVFWGIFMLLVMLGSGSGLSNGVGDDFTDSATNSVFLWGNRTTVPWKGRGPGREMRFDVADAEAIRAQVPEAAVVCPRNQLGGFRGGNNVTRGAKAGAFSIHGDYPEIARIQSVRLVGGRFIDHLDIEERRKVAVIGPRVQEVLFNRGEDPIGGHIQINGADFKVIGLFKPRRSENQHDDSNQSLFVPFTTFRTAFNYGDRVGWFAITSKPGVPASVVEGKVLALLKERHGVAPDDDRALGHFNLEKEFGQIEGLFGGIETLIWIVGIGTLAAGVIGVSNIMLVIVRERTNEIGIRRAVGATPFAVMAQVILESLVLTGVAGSLGLMAGVGAVELTARLTAGASIDMFRNPEVDLATALQTLAILVVSGILAGVFPARRAVSSSPVEALRAVV
jgi:putative ABC transport system permease protein